VKACNQGDEAIPTVSELGALECGIPAALLFIETTDQQVHLTVNLSVGMTPKTEALGTLALVNVLLRHGINLRDMP
jgi:hypothetical protein